MLRLWMLGSLTLLLLLHDTDADADSECALDPPRLIGEYGTHEVVNCTTTDLDHEGIDWRLGGRVAFTEPFQTHLSLVVPLTDWDVTADCSVKLASYECSKNLEIIIYQKPTRVGIFPMDANAVVTTLHGITQHELQCDIQNVAPVQYLTVSWFKNNQSIKTNRFNDTIKTPVNVTSTLRVGVTRADDGAQFRCEAELDLAEGGSHVVSDTYTLSVHYAPEFKNNTDVLYVSVNEGDDVTLSCAAEGNPPPEFSWTSEDMSDMDLDFNTDTLNITAVTSAIYNCAARNKLGNITRQIHVDVRKAPLPTAAIKKNPDTVSISASNHNQMEEGQKHQLNCNIVNVAPVQNLRVRWFRGSKTVHRQIYNDTSLTPVNVSSTFDFTLRREDNGASIRCEAEMDFGPDGPQLPVMHDAYPLSVHYPPEFKNNTDVLYVTVNEGDDVTLSCDAEGNPPPVFSWTYEDMIDMDVGDLETDTLNIIAVTSAIYNCTASNDQGEITRHIHVDVRKAPLPTAAIKKNPDTVSISAWNHNQMEEGQKHQLNCNIINVAPVQNLRVRWFRGSKMVHRQIYNDTSLTPVNVSSTFDFTPKREDNGASIRCVTEMDFGPDGPQLPVMHDTYILSVYYAPEFKNNTDVLYVSVNEGDDVTLSCAAEGNPPPVFSWTDEDMIDMDEDFNTDTLNITAVTSAIYNCTARNKLGTITRQIYVDVRKTPPLARDAPTGCPLKLMPREVVVKYGDPVSVNCSHANPEVMDIGWEAKNGGLSPKEVSLLTWTVQELHEWTEKPMCFANLKNGSQCSVTAGVTLYKTPDTVSISTWDHKQMVEGQEHQLKCDIVNVAPVQNLRVKWFRGNKMVHMERYINTSVTPVSRSATLYFTPRREDNGASIRCEAELDFGPDGPQPPVTYDTYLLSVHYAPRFKNNRDDVYVTVYEGDDVTLSCDAEGNPPPEFSWISEDMSDMDVGDLETDTLNITAATSAIYNCTASNELGTITRQIHVDVRKVAIKKNPDTVSISSWNHDQMVEGQEHQLKCDIVNVAPVQNLQVKWYRGNETVHIERYNDTSVTPVTVSSTFDFTPKREDNGANISCEAELDFGPDEPKVPIMSSPSYTANVHYKPVFLACPASHTCLEHHCTLDKLPCRADGNPKPTVLWTYQGKTVSASKPLSRSQSGKYTAEIRNNLGTDRTYIEVTFKYAPSFKEGNQTKEVSQEEDVTFHCSAEGNPPPKIRWIYTSAENVQIATRGHQSNISITKATSTNDGVYQCFAENEVGNATRHVKLIVKGELGQESAASQTPPIINQLYWILPILIIAVTLLAVTIVCIKNRKKQKRYSLVPAVPLSPVNNGVPYFVDK